MCNPGEPPPHIPFFTQLAKLCEDPLCARPGPHYPREYGCRWHEGGAVDGITCQLVTLFRSVDAAEVSVLAVDVEPVAEHEGVTDGEANVIGNDGHTPA